MKCPQTEQTEQTEQTVPSWAAAHMNMQQGAAGAGAGVPSCPHLPPSILIINTLHLCVANCSAAVLQAPWPATCCHDVSIVDTVVVITVGG